jgi:hypothetical protein
MWYDTRRTFELGDIQMLKSLIPQPAHAPADNGAREVPLTDSRLAAVVEAAYLLDAVRR